MNGQTTLLTQNDRLLETAAHVSILLGFFSGNLAGIAIAAIIWLTQREKSRWVGLQGLQALVYQALGFVLLLVMFGCWFVLWMLSLLPLMVRPEAYTDAPPPTFFVGFGALCIPFAVMGLWLLYGLYGALRAYSGADFRYIIIGDWLARQMGGNAQGKVADI